MTRVSKTSKSKYDYKSAPKKSQHDEIQWIISYFFLVWKNHIIWLRGSIMTRVTKNAMIIHYQIKTSNDYWSFPTSTPFFMRNNTIFKKKIDSHFALCLDITFPTRIGFEEKWENDGGMKKEEQHIMRNELLYLFYFALVGLDSPLFG